MLTEIEMDTKVCGKCGEVKLIEEFSKKKASKDGRQSKCKACEKESHAKWCAANPEKKKESHSKWCAANPEKVKENQAKWSAANPDYQAEYRAANPEKRKESQAKYYAANPEKEKERKAKYYAANPDYHAEYKKAHPEKCRAWCSNYRAAKLEAIPSWLTEEDWQSMEDIGKEADRLTRETGVKYEVDHIHPLRGKLICGLQCPDNLQILTKSQNCSKGNRFTPYVESELLIK